MRTLSFIVAGTAWLAGAVAGLSQTALINDTNTAIILWKDSSGSLHLQRQPGFTVGAVVNPATADRRGTSLGPQGFATSIAGQSNQPAIGPQSSQPMIGQQGSPAPIPSITNQANLGIRTEPLIGPQTNTGIVIQPDAGVPGQQGFGTAIGVQPGSPAMSPEGVQPAMRPQDARPVLGGPRRGALGGATTPAGQGSGTGSK